MSQPTDKHSFALVTGATSGMGLEYGRQLAAMGYNIIVVSNLADENRAVAESLSAEYGIVAEPLYADLTRPSAAQDIFDYVEQRALRVDILVSNAGMLLFSQLKNTSAEALDKIIALHCTTPTKLCRLFAEPMRRRGRGHILLVSSITAWTPYPTISHYAATKAYLKSFGQALWYELRGSGVSVTTIFPSAVDTPFYSLSSGSRVWLKRLGVMLSAEDVVRKALRAMFRGHRRCLPGLITKIEAALCSLMPAWLLLPILKIPAVKRILEKV